MITINGKTYEGNNLSIINNVLIIDGVVQGEGLTGVVKVEVTGSLTNLKTDASVTVNGHVTGNIDAGGSVHCKDVEGSVDAGGSVNCGDVMGDIDVGGSVMSY